ncbi:GNAT family N-acetyltransferase [Microbacterium rhizosphaerae]|uniref:GNAT family N-acetyltransferase n=1 Tax=Microbacterium rhizosphaerae TaxID=1678237 RepID=A0ABZ0SHP7_9MICO|nr:GNAT family N-acetyltransferase [Microbacterium rhizosphaerae]WPR88239.1 GNAT family N-acetyltransferase [Microbacterium rhizosphaerae]
MHTTTVGLELRPMPVPTTLDAEDAADFVDMVRVRNLVYREISGHSDFDITPGELLPALQPTPYTDRMFWNVLVDGELVGRAGLDLPLEDGSRVGFWRVELRRDAWGRGVGTAAYELIERVARERGRSVLQTSVDHPQSDGPRLDAPTGFGSIPADRAARFLRDRGYALEQVVRMSALTLDDDTFARVAEHLAAARAASTDYRLVSWDAPTPAEFVAGYGTVKAAMSTDAPAAGIEYDAEQWDADRVAAHDRRYVDAGRRLHVTAAQHIATGELVAFTELVIGHDLAATTHQEDTLVARAHRGHRLGMLVKAAALLAWRDIAPDSRRVITFNAEENRPMLDINEALGFTPVSYEGEWKKELS